MAKWSKTDFVRITAESDNIVAPIRDNMDKGIESREVQDQIKALHQWLNNFFTCNLEILDGIGHVYSEHPDFVKMWQTKFHQDMPGFLQRSIEYYCHHNQSKDL